MNIVLLYLCELTNKKGHHIVRSHFCCLIVPSVANALYYLIKMCSTVSQLVTIYLQRSGADACMTIQTAMSFTCHMV
jgi:hypothetical protein